MEPIDGGRVYWWAMAHARMGRTAGDEVEAARARFDTWAPEVRDHIAGIFRNNPTLRFATRSLQAGDDFAVCEWTATVERDGRTLEWDGVDVFPLREGKIARKDVYSSSHRAREV